MAIIRSNISAGSRSFPLRDGFEGFVESFMVYLRSWELKGKEGEAQAGNSQEVLRKLAMRSRWWQSPI